MLATPKSRKQKMNQDEDDVIFFTSSNPFLTNVPEREKELVTILAAEHLPTETQNLLQTHNHIDWTQSQIFSNKTINEKVVSPSQDKKDKNVGGFNCNGKKWKSIPF